MLSIFGNFVGSIFGIKRKRSEPDDDGDECCCGSSNNKATKTTNCRKRKKFDSSSNKNVRCEDDDASSNNTISTVVENDSKLNGEEIDSSVNAIPESASSSAAINEVSLKLSKILKEILQSQTGVDLSSATSDVTKDTPTVTSSPTTKDTTKDVVPTPVATVTPSETASSSTTETIAKATTAATTSTKDNVSTTATSSSTSAATSNNITKDSTTVTNNTTSNAPTPKVTPAEINTNDKVKTVLLNKEMIVSPDYKVQNLCEVHADFMRRELIFPQVNKIAFVSAGLPIEKGLLLHGSLYEMRSFVQAFANELSALFGKPTRLFVRTPQDICKEYSTDADEIIKGMSKSVQKCPLDTPIIMLVEELRSFCNYHQSLTKSDANAVKALFTAMTTFLGTQSRYQRVFFIVTVDDLGIVPKGLLGPGYLAKTLAFSSDPDEKARKVYLKEAVKKWTIQPKDIFLDEIAKRTDGYSPEQLYDLTKMAMDARVRNTISDTVKECCSKCLAEPRSLKVSEATLKTIIPTSEDWAIAIKQIIPKKVKPVVVVAAKTEVKIEENNISFELVGGLDDQIKYLEENVIFPLKQKDELKEWGVEPVRGVIFYGPPGTGKTLLARAMANELNKVLIDETKPEEPPKKYTFFYRKASDCFNMYVGESEKILRNLFALAEKQAPSLIFFDEFDGLCATRNNSNIQFYTNIVTTLLGLMDSVTRGKVLVIAATNRLNSIDPAMRRPGRFDRAVGFSMPGKEQRESIIQVHTRSWKNGNSKEILEQIAEKTVGYSGADLEHLARETLILSMQRRFETKTPSIEVLTEDWYTALSRVKASNTDKNAYGSSSTSVEQVPPGVKLLLQTNLTKIEEKFQSVLDEVKENKTSNATGGLNSFLISSDSENDQVVDNYLIPLLLTESKLFKDVASYTLDLSDIQKLTKAKVQSTLDELRRPPDGKVPVLLLPQIDLFIKMKRNAEVIVEYVLTQLQSLRGKNVIVLATSKLPLKEMRQFEDIVNLFKDVEGSKSHEFTAPTRVELESFFKMIPRLEDAFPKQFAIVVKLGENKDMGTLLDLYAALKRILQLRKGEENKTDEIILQQLTSLIKAFENHKRNSRNDCHLYI